VEKRLFVLTPALVTGTVFLVGIGRTSTGTRWHA
jgi:hypothetical protein